jgi:hypothetical protein
MARRGGLIARWYAENTQTIISSKSRTNVLGQRPPPDESVLQSREQDVKIDTGIPPARHAQGLC